MRLCRDENARQQVCVSSLSQAFERRTPPTSQKSARMSGMGSPTRRISMIRELHGLRVRKPSSRFCSARGGSGSSSTSSAGDVYTGAEVVVRRQTRATDVKLMNPAMNDGSFASADIAATTDFVYARAAGHGRALESARLNIKAGCASEGAEGDGTNSGAQDGFVRVL